jgi:hypothetical protein
MTTEEFETIVSDWLRTAKHLRFEQPYTELVYQPMLELLEYLRANGFKTFIVSGGGVEFMRPWTEPVYGVPPEQVVGSTIRTKYEIRDGRPVLMRLPEIDFVDDKAGKPVGINKFIGRRPIFASGIRMVISRCCGGSPRAKASGWASSCTTPTPSVNTLRSGGPRRRSQKGPRRRGPKRLDGCGYENGLEAGFCDCSHCSMKN